MVPRGIDVRETGGGVGRGRLVSGEDEEETRRMSRTVPFSSLHRLATAFEIIRPPPPPSFSLPQDSRRPLGPVVLLRSVHPHPPVVPHLLPRALFAETFRVVCAKTGDSIVSSAMYAGKAVAVERMIRIQRSRVQCVIVEARYMARLVTQITVSRLIRR